MLVFIDTEFTNFHNPKLISIGLASETGETFYAEIPYPRAECSDFVKEVVAPLLGASAVDFCDADELRERLRTWLLLVKRHDDIDVCFDSGYDWRLFGEVFNNQLPSFCRGRNIGFYEVNELLRYDFHRRNQRPEHHALNDAEALRYSFRPRVSS